MSLGWWAGLVGWCLVACRRGWWAGSVLDQKAVLIYQLGSLGSWGSPDTPEATTFGVFTSINPGKGNLCHNNLLVNIFGHILHQPTAHRACRIVPGPLSQSLIKGQKYNRTMKGPYEDRPPATVREVTGLTRSSN